MSVTVRPYRRGGWEVDIRVRPAGRVASIGSAKRRRCPRSRRRSDGARTRERRAAACTAPPQPNEGGAHTRRVRADDSSTATRGRIVRSRAGLRRRRRSCNVHLVPRSATKTLDAITNEDVQRLKHASADEGAEDRQQRADGAERAAEDGRRVGRHRADAVHDSAAADRRSTSARFHDFEEYERLVEAARATRPDART